MKHSFLIFPDRSLGAMVVKENSIDAAVNYVEKAHGLSLAKHSLTLTKENSVCSDGSCPLVSGL